MAEYKGNGIISRCVCWGREGRGKETACLYPLAKFSVSQNEVFHVNWLLHKVNLPFHFYLLSRPGLHLYRFYLANNNNNNKCAGNLIRWKWQTLFGVCFLTPEVIFFFFFLKKGLWMDNGHNAVRSSSRQAVWKWMGLTSLLSQPHYCVCAEG